MREREGGSNSVVESQPSKLLVAGSIPVSRSRFRSLASLGELRLGKAASEVCRAEAPQAVGGHLHVRKADVAQSAERVLGKDEVTSSILVIGSRLRSLACARELRLGKPASLGCRAEAQGEGGQRRE